MRGLTYPDLAARYEVDVCFDGCFREHSRGMVDSNGVIHWRGRDVTRSGLRRFLILVARARSAKDRDSEWLASYPRRERDALTTHYEATWAYRTALHDLGVRLPASLAAADKAKVRALLATAPYELRNSRVGRWAGMR